MSKNFKPGDIVQLKSGGPIMTVETVLETCTSASWFAYGKCHRKSFNPEALQAATVPEPAPAK
jgi:uncharacterized protein YodC (DUF2158 family)